MNTRLHGPRVWAPSVAGAGGANLHDLTAVHRAAARRIAGPLLLVGGAVAWLVAGGLALAQAML